MHLFSYREYIKKKIKKITNNQEGRESEAERTFLCTNYIHLCILPKCTFPMLLLLRKKLQDKMKRSVMINIKETHIKIHYFKLRSTF